MGKSLASFFIRRNSLCMPDLYWFGFAELYVANSCQMSYPVSLSPSLRILCFLRTLKEVTVCISQTIKLKRKGRTVLTEEDAAGSCYIKL